MSEQSAHLTQRLLVLFKGEARERITTIAAALQTLNGNLDDGRDDVIETAFREAHSLKAAAGVVGQSDISGICHAMESAFAAVKRGEIGVNENLLTCLHAAADALDDFLAGMDAAPTPEQHIRTGDLIEALTSAAVPRPSQAAQTPTRQQTSEASVAPSTVQAEGVSPADVSSPASTEMESRPREVNRPTAARLETVRLAAERLDALLRQAEEMLSDKMVARELAKRLEESVALFRGLSGDFAKTANDTSKVNEVALNAFARKLEVAARMAGASARSLSTKVDSLHEDMKKILTLQSAAIIQPLHRTVRDIARDQKKHVELQVRGGELEIDRRILEELKDPLLHLVRNSVDHGIETPEEREAVGKPPTATITITVAPRDGQRVEIILADDGRGVSTQKLAAVAIKRGILPPDHKSADAELQQLMFYSGVSTSAILTDISGRGLGLAIVRERVERLGGDITVESEPEKGTTFRIVVPLTLATYRGIIIRAGEDLFILPTAAVERIVAREGPAQHVDGRPTDDPSSMSTEDGPVPIISLRQILELPPAPRSQNRSRRLIAVLAGSDRRRVAVEIDGLIGEQEILVKSLGKTLTRVRNIQGATVLATGEIAPILNVPDLLKSAARILCTPQLTTDLPMPAAVVNKNILLAEDSITARSLLKSILESAGYQVKTAVDGMEAWTLLKTESFDLLVSDVEMPCMNGFDLTARIRSDAKLFDLPVVLVTALESRADLERGVDVGANAYIRKGGFEQDQLLEAVRRFA